MRIPIGIYLFISYLLVLLAGTGLAGSLAWRTVEQLYLDSQRENLLAQARLTASAFQGEYLPILPAQPYIQMANTLAGVHERLIGEEGAVLLDSTVLAGEDPIEVPAAEQVGYVAPDELLARPEIKKALSGQPATFVRSFAFGSFAADRRVLYAAAPVFSRNNEVIGIAYLAMPLPASGLPPSVTLELLGAVLLTALLAGLAGSILTRRIARPLENLAGAANAVASGDLQQRPPPGTDIREVHGLAQAFDRMTESLRRSRQVHNAFIADVTHELRTPLTVIKGTVETLEDGALDDLKGRGPLLESMHCETERLIRLVNDLLLLTRADAGALQLDLRPLDLSELARSRCEGLSLLASRRGVKLEVVEAGDDPSNRCCVLGDADRLAQVLDNLLDNAIRYAPEASSVTVRIRQVGDEVECAVGDRGPGIPPEHLDLIFERFYRADASRQRQTGGAGLGLAIVRALVLAQGGRICAKSAPGDGTSIIFWLPSVD